MKKSCKLLCAAAAIAALVPYSHTRDIATGEATFPGSALETPPDSK